MNTSERVVNVLMGMLRGERIDLDSYRTLYGKSGRTFHRDLEAIRNNEYFTENHILRYDAVQKKHYVNSNGVINSAEILVILNILIGSRALTKEDLDKVTNKLLELVATEDQAKIKTLLAMTSKRYMPEVNSPIFPRAEQFENWIMAKKSITFEYNGLVNEKSMPSIQTGVPLSIHYDHHHFYIMMYLIDEDKNFLYRLDKFGKITPKGRTVNVPADKRPDFGRMFGNDFFVERS